MRTVLVIEDDEIVLRAVTSILTKAGYNVVAAKNGKEGFEKIDAGVYDVVLTDLLMPYANGLEVVSRIKTDPEKYKTGVLVISSVGNEDLVTEAFKLGADDFMKKPIMIGELQMRIQRIISRKAA